MLFVYLSLAKDFEFTLVYLFVLDTKLKLLKKYEASWLELSSGVCLFFLCLCGFSPSALDSSRSLWTIRGTGDSKLAVGEYESLRLSVCVSQDALML